MQGCRVDYPGPNTLVHHQPGNYWKTDTGHWHGVTPNGLYCGLNNHHVEEHEDGTISVTDSSILTRGGPDEPTWHGYIRRGVWERC